MELYDKYIASEKEFCKFIDILPPILENSGDVYFMTLAARNKYLTPDQKDKVGFTGTKMFGNVIIYPNDHFKSAINKLYSSLAYKRTPSHYEFPDNSLVAYFCINPCSLPRAYQDFTNRINKAMFDQLIEGNGDWGFLNKIEHKLTTSVHRNISKKYFVDIDIDYHIPLDSQIFKSLNSNNIDYHIIETQGGYHVLILTKSLKGSNFRLQDELNQLRSQYPDIDIGINSNYIVPIPGTIQNEKLVKFVYSSK